MRQATHRVVKESSLAWIVSALASEHYPNKICNDDSIFLTAVKKMLSNIFPNKKPPLESGGIVVLIQMFFNYTKMPSAGWGG